MEENFQFVLRLGYLLDIQAYNTISENVIVAIKYMCIESTFPGVNDPIAIRHINSFPLKLTYTSMMNCPSCGAIMVWLNGSVLHDPPVKQYECRHCHLFVVRYQDGNYEIVPIELKTQQQ